MISACYKRECNEHGQTAHSSLVLSGGLIYNLSRQMRFIDLEAFPKMDSETRVRAARAIFERMSASERETLAAEIVSMIEGHPRPRAKPIAKKAKVVAAPTQKPESSVTPPPVVVAPAEAPIVAVDPRSKTDRAEDYVLSSQGVTTRQVADLIKQSPKVAGTTLNQVMHKRGSIVNIDGKWYSRNSSEAKAKQADLLLAAANEAHQ